MTNIQIEDQERTEYIARLTAQVEAARAEYHKLVLAQRIMPYRSNGRPTKKQIQAARANMNRGIAALKAYTK